MSVEVETSSISTGIHEMRARMEALRKFADSLSKNLDLAARSFSGANFARTLRYVEKIRGELESLSEALRRAEQFASSCQSLANAYLSMKFEV